jgi:N-acetylmuramoyl-L-alanine amidase
MKQALILDPAHGKDTPGKRSPDGKHREYLWSRERLINIINNILPIQSLGFDLYYPFLYHENEPGLTTRGGVKYNSISKDYDNTLVISLHNDAFGDGSEWTKPFGNSVWTSKGQDESDKYATDWYNYFKSKYPNDNWRGSYYSDDDPDKEEDFTILAGNKRFKPLYKSFLIEWGFQTNKDDVSKLLNPKHNEYFEDMMSEYLINLKL